MHPTIPGIVRVLHPTAKEYPTRFAVFATIATKADAKDDVRSELGELAYLNRAMLPT